MAMKIFRKFLFLSLAGTLSFGSEPIVGISHEWVIEDESLAKVLQIFSVRHQVLTTYEDPVFCFHADVQDLSSRIRRPSDVRGETNYPPFYIRREDKLSLAYRLPSTHVTDEDITRALWEIINVYNSGEYPGKFRVEPNPPVWHIIPTEVRDKKGEWVKVTPFLDKIVNVHTAHVRLYKYIFFIMDEAIINTPIVKFGFLRNQLGSNPPDVDIQGGAFTLREFLTNTFVKNIDGIFWQMVCRPAEELGKLSRVYLNLFQVKPKPHPAAKRIEAL
jgi:hypothetical protein